MPQHVENAKLRAKAGAGLPLNKMPIRRRRLGMKYSFEEKIPKEARGESL
jgi:hypothetical protein